MSVDRVVIFRGADRQWYWHRVAPNSQILAVGEAHRRRWNARRAAKRANPDLPADAFVVEQ